MKRTTKYVAFDVHQATTVASVREESGRVIARSVLPTDVGALTEFVRGMRGAVHVTFEEGTQAQWLHDLLVPMGLIQVLPPLAVQILVEGALERGPVHLDASALGLERLEHQLANLILVDRHGSLSS